METLDLYLASGSPRRKELLQQLGYQFDILKVDVEEKQQQGEAASDYVERLAQDKAQAGVNAIQTLIPVLGADTIVVVDSRVLEKPRDLDDAKEMLMLLSGREHQVMTAVCIADKHKKATVLVTTSVWFKPLSEQEIISYWHSGEPCDKAGGYGIQGVGGKFVTRIEGSYYAVVGLPLMETDQLLTEFKHI
jgi:septum formation protein